MPTTSSTTDQHRTVLCCAADNVFHESAQITPESTGVDAGAAWSVTKRTLRGGRQDGVGVITLDNGRLQIDLVETRGLNVLEVRSGDLRFGWDSPVKEVVHPQGIDLASRGGLGWLEGFNEFIARCGLEYAGAPGRDVFTTNTGDQGELDLTLHGRISNLPASRVEVLVDREPPHRVRVRGEVYERQFYGPNLRLVAEVSTTPGSSTFQVADEVTNLGADPQEFELIYHGNFGRPLLEAGAEVRLPAKSVTPINDRAAEDTHGYATYLGPTPGYTEQVYLIEPIGGADAETVALLHDAEGQRGASVRWSLNELPCFTLWKCTQPEAAGYVTGLEPGTCYPFNRSEERRRGRLPTLAAGESRRFVLDYALHSNNAEVMAVREEIDELQGNHKTRFAAEPPRVG